MTTHEKQNQPGTAVQPIDPGLVAKWAEMVTLIPAEDAGGADRIFAQLLDAESWEDLNAPWEAAVAEHLVGRRLLLRGASRRPSDFREGLGMFLVLDLWDPHGKRGVVATTSSMAILAQITRAYALKALPLLVEFVVAERPTQAGYRPHHLKIIGSGAGQAGSDGQDT
jgi:hypothetical protein